MQPITIEAELDENHQVTLSLPELPQGRVRVTVEPLEDIDNLVPGSREWVRAKLRAAGLLAENIFSAEEAIAEELSEEEEEALARKFSGGRSIQDLIDEDREERF
jgi:hypothetical protein